MTELKQKYDASTVALMRQALSEIVTDRRFLARRSVTTLEMAEYILEQAAAGVAGTRRGRACVWGRVTPGMAMPRGGPQARAVEEAHASAPVEPPTRDQGVYR